MRTLLALVALAATFSAGAPGGSVDDFVDDFVDDEMAASGVPGLAYAVVADGRTEAVGARGVVRRGGGVAVTEDTPFLLGSISKSFTALSVMQLVEAGTVDLDTQVGDYLEAFSGVPAGAITVRQLLSHTSGYSTTQGNTSRPSPTDAGDELARAAEELAAVTPEGPAGTRWDYSNANYVILGRLVEVASGQAFQAYVTEHVLRPVGMDHSFVADGEVHDEMATGHRPWFGTKRPLPDNSTDRATAPQGGVVASADDLARYLQMTMNGEDDVLSAEGKALMMRPASDASPSYGLGWHVDASTGAVWHDGVSPGVETLAVMVPAEEKAALVLVNGGSGFGFGETGRLRTGIVDRALGLDVDRSDGSDGSDGSAWSRQSLFVALVVMPVVYLLSMLWAWRHRAGIRAKTRSGVAGLLSLWFPLVTTLAAAWVLLGLVPGLFGTPLGTLHGFSPDLASALAASGVTGVAWAVFRLAVAYTAPDRAA